MNSKQSFRLVNKISTLRNEESQKLKVLAVVQTQLAELQGQIRVLVQELNDEYLNGLHQAYEASDKSETYKEFSIKYNAKKIVESRQEAVDAVKESGRNDGLTVDQPVASQSLQPSGTTGAPSSLDDSTPILTSRIGVHLAEQQQTVDRKGVDGNVRPMTNRANAHLNEEDWDLNKMLFRENLVSAFQWQITDTAGTELAIVGTAPTDVPADLLQNDLVSSPFQRFIFWNCDRIRVRFQLVASRFHQGRALVYFVPSCLPKSLQQSAIRSATWATQLQHGFLDPANGTVLDMVIPFRFHKGFIDLVFGDSLGQLHFKILNGLQAATGASTSVEVKVFVSFENSRFRIPRPGGESFLKSLLEKEAKRLGLKLTPATAAKLDTDKTIRKRQPDDYEIIEALKESGMLEAAGAGVGRKLDNLIDDILPAEVTGAIAGVLLDKPAVTEYPEPLVNKDAQYMSASRGIEKLERMTLEPSAQYITTDQFGDSVDEMDMKYLLKKPVYYTSFNWASTDSVGDVLFETIVSPSHLTAETIPAAGTTFDATILGFLANMFTYWRGSIVFIVQFVGTAFHEGRIDFCNHPATTTIPTDYAAAMSQYVNSQTIRNTNNTVEVRIPFHSDIPWKRVWMGETLADVQTTNAVRSTDYVTGSFSIRVAVPLKNPNNVANNIDVNIFVCAGDDFEFHTMSLIGGRYRVFGLTEEFLDRKEKAFRKRLEQQRARRQIVDSQREAGDLNTDDKTDSGVISLGIGDAKTNDVSVHHFGESYHNLREMCKRYSHLGTDYGEDVAGTYVARFNPLPRNLPGFIGLMFNCYRFFRGPMNFKIQVWAHESNSGVLSYPPFTGFVTTNVQPAGFSTGAPAPGPMAYQSPADPRAPPLVRYCHQRQIAEFQIPFQSIYHSLLNPLLTDDPNAYYNNAFTQFDLIAATVIPTLFPGSQVHTYCEVAFADETRLGAFMGFPSLTARTTQLWPNPGS